MKNLFDKYSTGVRGLDDLFYGGLRFDHLERLQAGSKNGLIIVIRGARGVHKTLLAMQMLHGLARNILETYKECQFSKPLFFSLNKKRDSLLDMYLDLLMSMQACAIVRDSVSGDKSKWQSNAWAKSLFDLASGIDCMQSDGREGLAIPDDCIVHADKYIAERSLYYNPRTNALHFRRGKIRDDFGNLLFCRKFDTLQEYCANGKCSLKSLPPQFQADFFDVGFNVHDKEAKSQAYLRTSLDSFSKVLEQVELLAEEQRCPCCVIDGFSGLDTHDLENLPFAHMEVVLRSAAAVSIVVFDQRGENLNFNADIVLEMRQSQIKEEKYTYHELRVAKSVFHSASLGWHQYKKRDDGLEIFPSLHLLLQRRYYLAHILTTTHAASLEDSYEYFLMHSGKTQYSGYVESEKFKARRILREIVESNMKYRELPLQGGMSSELDLLEKVLLGPRNGCGLVASFVGNPNTYKRFLMRGGVYSAAMRREHTLIVLFDKDLEVMRRSTFCPAYMDSDACKREVPCLDDKQPMGGICSVCNVKSCKLSDCEQCSQYVHYFPLRMGGVFADEFLSVLHEQMEIPFSDGRKVSRIVIDDLQRIDYSFPFLKREKLFLSALINLCREKRVELCVLCDKKASFVQELCALSDNVICTKRELADEVVGGGKSHDKVTVYLERVIGHTGAHPCEIFQYDIDEASKMFCCKGGKLQLNVSLNDKGVAGEEAKAGIVIKEIDSMKQYWRAKYDVNPDLRVESGEAGLDCRDIVNEN